MITIAILYINYRNGIIPEGVSDYIGLFVNVGVLGLLIVGGGGWIVLFSICEFEDNK